MCVKCNAVLAMHATHVDQVNKIQVLTSCYNCGGSEQLIASSGVSDTMTFVCECH